MATKAIGNAPKKAPGGKLFKYVGKDRASGRSVNGEIVAQNEAEAKKKLTRRGVQVIAVSKVKAAKGKKIKPREVTIFTRQMATMMKAGIPLLQSFEIAAKGQANQRMMDVLMKVRADVEAGVSLGNAFAKFPDQFDNLYCSLVTAGEAGGVLDLLLDKLASYKEKVEAIKRKVKGALTYPIIISVVAITLILVMMVFVLPAFKKVYESMGAKLPWLTEQVITLSNLFVDNIILIVIFLAALFIGLPLAIKNSFALQKKRDRFLLKAPIFGPIITKSSVARWARTLATLFTAGVPLVETLSTVGGASGNIIYEEATRQIQQDVKKGISLTFAMNSTGMFPVMVVQMASIGEESGALDDMLNKAAEFLEDEVDAAVGMLSAMLEPFIIVFLGVVVGTLLVAMYLPLFNIGDAIN